MYIQYMYISADIYIYIYAVHAQEYASIPVR